MLKRSQSLISIFKPYYLAPTVPKIRANDSGCLWLNVVTGKIYMDVLFEWDSSPMLDEEEPIIAAIKRIMGC